MLVVIDRDKRLSANGIKTFGTHQSQRHKTNTAISKSKCQI